MRFQEIRNTLVAASVASLLLTIARPAGAQMTGMPGMPGMSGTSQTRIAGPYRIVLVVLPAEPFYTQAQVTQNHVKEGMLIVGGAAPVRIGAESRPNHHLVVHIYDRKTGKALRGMHVTISYAAVGAPVSVPIVEMQAIGKGPASTHYGNNVTLKPGTYRVIVTANHASASFTVHVA